MITRDNQEGGGSFFQLWLYCFWKQNAFVYNIRLSKDVVYCIASFTSFKPKNKFIYLTEISHQGFGKFPKSFTYYLRKIRSNKLLNFSQNTLVLSAHVWRRFTKRPKSQTKMLWIDVNLTFLKLWNWAFKGRVKIVCTAKLVYSDHPRGPKFVAVIDRWSLTQVWLYVEKHSRSVAYTSMFVIYLYESWVTF